MARISSQLLSRGPPATPSRLPLRSASKWIDELGGDHQRADSAGKRNQGEHRPCGALAGDPDRIDDNHVDLARKQRNRGRIPAGKFENLHVNAFIAIKPMCLDDVEFPIHGAGFQHADADDLASRGHG